MMDEFGWFGHGVGWLIMLLFWALVIGGGVALVWWLTSLASARPRTPLDILKARYARGEIGEQEYERMRRQLQE